MLIKKLVLALILFCSLQTFAQKIIIHGEETSRLLKWDDFTGRPNMESPYFAFTYWNTTYKYDAFQFKGDTVKWQVQITLDLGTNSWRKRDKVTDTLLKHEQGHFDIGIICSIEMQQKINTTVFLRHNYQAQLSTVIKEIVDKYKQMDLLYDEESNHHANREQQWKWDAFFANKIKRPK